MKNRQKINWIHSEHYDKIVSELRGKKITHVVQNRSARSYGCIYWRGEFSDGTLFRISFITGIIFVTIGDRELDFWIKVPDPLAYDESVKSSLTCKSLEERISSLLFVSQKTTDLYDKLDFKEIMDICMLEYESPNMEIFEESVV